MAEVACLDTNIVIWGIQGRAHPSQGEMVSRSRALIANLRKEKVRVIIPSIVLGEFLIGLPLDEHPRYEQLVRSKFPIIPYDFAASMIFARIWRTKTDEQTIARIKAEENPPTRAQLRADLMIIATAISAGCSCIYGHERRFYQYTEGFIRFEHIDDLELQTDSFYADVNNSLAFSQIERPERKV
jgi:predicted nucleic acid-binding protein